MRIFKLNLEVVHRLRNRGEGSVENQGVYISK